MESLLRVTVSFRSSFDNIPLREDGEIIGCLTLLWLRRPSPCVVMPGRFFLFSKSVAHNRRLLENRMEKGKVEYLAYNLLYYRWRISELFQGCTEGVPCMNPQRRRKELVQTGGDSQRLFSASIPVPADDAELSGEGRTGGNTFS